MRQTMKVAAAFGLAVSTVISSAAYVMANVSPTSANQNQLAHDVAVVRGYYHNHPGLKTEFGGLFFVQGSPIKLIVVVTDDPPDRPYPWEARLLYPDQLGFRTGDFSLRHLQRISQQIRADVGEAWTRGLTGVAISERKNRVLVYFRTGEAPPGFAKHYDIDAILVRQKLPDGP